MPAPGTSGNSPLIRKVVTVVFLILAMISLYSASAMEARKIEKKVPKPDARQHSLTRQPSPPPMAAGKMFSLRTWKRTAIKMVASSAQRIRMIMSRSCAHGKPNAHGHACAKGNGDGDQAGLDRADDAGEQISADGITDRIGDGEAWHKQHERSDDDAVRVADESKLMQKQGRRSQEDTGHDDPDDEIDLCLFAFLHEKLCEHADRESGQGIRQRSAKERREKHGDEAAGQRDIQRTVIARLLDLQQFRHDLFKGHRLSDTAPGDIVDAIDALQIERAAAHAHDARITFSICGKGEKHAGRDDKGACFLHAIGFTDAADGVFSTVDLRTAFQ